MKITRTKKWVSDEMLNELLRAFEAGTTLEAGTLSYQHYDFNELYEILPDAFSVKPTVSRSEAIGLFYKALRACRHAQTMTAAALIEQASALHRQTLAVPLERYSLWSKFRARDMVHSKGFSLNWRGVTLRTTVALPAWMRREDYLLSGVGYIFPEQPEGYGYVIMSCDERDENRAVDRMMDALQLMLGLLNLYESWRRHTHWGGRNWTEGKLWPGPTQFVFRGKAFRGDNRIWFNPDYDEDAWGHLPPDMKRILEVVPWARKALASLDTHPLREVLVRAVMLLQDGLVSRDGSLRLLRYWSALEQLYVEADAKNGSNDKVIERALFGEREAALSRWKLAHIARLRNDYVHAGVSGDDLHDLGQFLRELVVRHINYWIFRGADLADHAAMLQFVKLPSGHAALEQLRILVHRRLALTEARPPDSDAS